MRWAQVEEQLTRTLADVRRQTTHESVFAPAEPVNLHKLLVGALEPGDEETYDVDGLDSDHWPGTALALLQQRWTLDHAFAWEWQSLGPMVWYSTLGWIDIGDGRDYVYLCHEEAPLRAIAAVEPAQTEAAWSWLFTDLCRSNGNPYGVDLFGSLPGETTNFAPHLVPSREVWKAYELWLDEGDPDGFGWDGLARDVIGREVYSTPYERAMAVLADVPQLDDPAAIDQYLHADPLPETSRQLILQEYFNRQYTEDLHEPTPRS